MAVDWRLDRLDRDADEIARLSELLDPAETARAARHAQTLHRNRFIVRRAVLRQWLGACLNVAPAAVAIATDAMGKPHAPGWDRHFSTSHSRDTLLLASAPRPLGCDIEWIDPAFDWRPIAQRLFAREEHAALAGMDEAMGRTAFFHCWARKEAFVKAIGLGLSHPLDAFAVTGTAPPRLLRGGEGWDIAAIEVAGHAAAIVVAAQT
jgi:4'-phosphopantetheinyl transferase